MSQHHGQRTPDTKAFVMGSAVYSFATAMGQVGWTEEHPKFVAVASIILS